MADPILWLKADPGGGNPLLVTCGPGNLLVLADEASPPPCICGGPPVVNCAGNAIEWEGVFKSAGVIPGDIGQVRYDITIPIYKLCRTGECASIDSSSASSVLPDVERHIINGLYNVWVSLDFAGVNFNKTTSKWSGEVSCFSTADTGGGLPGVFQNADLTFDWNGSAYEGVGGGIFNYHFNSNHQELFPLSISISEAGPPGSEACAIRIVMAGTYNDSIAGLGVSFFLDLTARIVTAPPIEACDIDGDALSIAGQIIFQGTLGSRNTQNVWTHGYSELVPLNVYCADGGPGTPPCNAVLFGGGDIGFDVTQAFNFGADSTPQCQAQAGSGSIHGEVSISGFYIRSSGGIENGEFSYHVFLTSVPGGIGVTATEVLLEFQFHWNGSSYDLAGQVFSIGGGFGDFYSDPNPSITLEQVEPCRLRIGFAAAANLERTTTCPIGGAQVPLLLGAAPWGDFEVAILGVP